MSNADVAQLEARFEARTIARDAENAAVRDTLTRLVESHRNLENTVAALGTRVDDCSARPQPGVLSFWGPTLATAVALASLGGFVLSQDRKPLEAEILALKEAQRSMSSRVKDAEEKQYDSHAEIAGIQSKISGLEQNQILTREERQWRTQQ